MESAYGVWETALFSDVRYRKWSPTENDPHTASDPHCRLCVHQICYWILWVPEIFLVRFPVSVAGVPGASKEYGRKNAPFFFFKLLLPRLVSWGFAARGFFLRPTPKIPATREEKTSGRVPRVVTKVLLLIVSFSHVSQSFLAKSVFLSLRAHCY